MFFHAELVARSEIADSVIACRFRRPPDFMFKAGQYLQITLPKLVAHDPKGNNRVFSIASAPGDPYIMIATRLTGSAFGQTLVSLPPGLAVEIEGPFGGFTLPSDTDRKLVFVAGGIGVTPFRSMVKHASEEHLPHRIMLCYANHAPASAAFLEDFRGWAHGNRRFRFVPLVTDLRTEVAGWSGEVGTMDERFFKRILDDLSAPLYYVAGPPYMVRGMIRVLLGCGIASTNIKSEEFSGY